MAFTNSPLVTYTRISPNRNSPRTESKITKITIHHIAGVCSVETFGNIVASPSRRMSANYAIGNDGRIGLFCEEKDRSWCSSSALNDNKSVTIEVSNCSTGGDWPIGQKAYDSLIKLCVDICKRNGIPKLEFTGDENGSLTYHYMFSSTGCPGPWIKAHTQEICNKVNAQLNAKPEPKGYTVNVKANTQILDNPNGKKVGVIDKAGVYTIIEDKKIGYITYGKLKSGAGWIVIKDETPATKPSTGFKAGDLVSIASNAVYYNGGGIPEWVKRENWYISSISGDRAVLGQNQAKNRNIQSPINTKFLTKVGSTNNQIKVGDWVKVVNPIIYGTNKKFVVYVSKYKVLELKGDRAVISSDGKNTTAAISTSNIVKI